MKLTVYYKKNDYYLKQMFKNALILGITLLVLNYCLKCFTQFATVTLEFYL